MIQGRTLGIKDRAQRYTCGHSHSFAHRQWRRKHCARPERTPLSDAARSNSYEGAELKGLTQWSRRASWPLSGTLLTHTFTLASAPDITPGADESICGPQHAARMGEAGPRRRRGVSTTPARLELPQRSAAGRRERHGAEIDTLGRGRCHRGGVLVIEGETTYRPGVRQRHIARGAGIRNVVVRIG